MTTALQNYNGITLAYLGDAVLELLIREALLASGVSDTGRLSAAAQRLVCAPAQSKIAEALLPSLTADEEAAYRLGRNHRVNGKPKNASAAEYSRATGLEAVFGYLHVMGERERIRALFEAGYAEPLKEVCEKI